MEKEEGIAIFGIILWICLAVGWVMNVVKFIKCDFKAPAKTEVIRGVGIAVAPVGAVIGWFDIGEEKD